MNDILYVSDLDRTLLNSDIKVSEKSEEIINDLISKGMNFTIATARSWYSAYGKVECLDLELPVSTYNGSYIVNPVSGEVIESKIFEKSERENILDSFLEENIFPLVYSFIEGEEKVSWIGKKENVGLRKYLDYRKRDERLRKIEYNDRLYDGEPFYFTAIDKKEKLERILPFFDEQEYLSYHFQKDLNTDDHYWLEVKHKEADKASSVSRIKEMTGCSRVISFGDNVNDIPMFSVSDEGYAVSNANEELKELAIGIIPTSDEDGVAEWLKANFSIDL